MKAGEAKNGPLGSRRVISDGGIKHLVPFPSPSSRPGIVTSNQSCISRTPPRAQLRQGTMGQTAPLACRTTKNHPSAPQSRRFFGDSMLDFSSATQRGQSSCRVASCACRRSRPLSPEGHRGQWAAALGRLAASESLCRGDYRSITSPVVAKGLSAVKQSPTAFQSAAAPASGLLRSVDLGLPFSQRSRPDPHCCLARGQSED